MKKNFMFYVLPTLIPQAFSIILLPVFTYYLDPVDYGIVAALAIVTGLMMALSETGAGWVISANYYRLNENDRKELLFNQAFLEGCLKVFWGFVFWLFAKNILPLIITEYSPILLFYFKFLLITFFLQIINSTVLSTIIIQKKGRFFALIQLSGWISGLLTSLYCLIILKLDILALLIGPLVSAIVMFILQIPYFRKNITLKLRKKWLMESINTGFPALPKTLSSFLLTVCDKFLIQKWMSLSALGIYSHSLSYRALPDMLNKSFNRSFTPEFMESYTKSRDISPFKDISKYWIALFLVMAMFFVCYSTEVINILTHGKFVAAAPLVPLWFFASFLTSYSLFYNKLILYFKKTKFFLYTGVTAGLINLSLNIVLIQEFGMIGAAAATIVSISFMVLSHTFYAKKLSKVDFADFKFTFSIGLIIVTYILNFALNPSLLAKTTMFIVSTIFIIYYFNLIPLIKAAAKYLPSIWKTK
jgi:O-antigen/teichoic acid export membrane protein